MSPPIGLRRYGPGLVKFLVLAGVLGLVGYHAAMHLDYPWQWYRVPGYLFSLDQGIFTPGPLLEGLFVTLNITALSLVLSLSLGLSTAILRLSGPISARILARAYLELVRNTPLLIQIFFLYFVLSPVFSLSAFASAVLALSLFEGAYASEIFRSGIESIPKGQWEAAKALGLNSRQTYVRIILPQAVRRILPPLTGQAVSLVKDSALAGTIAVYELTMQGQIIVADTFLTFEVWFTVAGVYLAVTATLSLTVYFLERRANQGFQYAGG